MGGQACIFYGAAEFSRDLDLLILADSANLPNVKRGLDALKAEVVAVPPLEERFLLRGHAIHLRCRRDLCCRTANRFGSKEKCSSSFLGTVVRASNNLDPTVSTSSASICRDSVQ
jgi:hypothetical protein